MNVLKILDSTDQRGAVLQALDVCRNGKRFGIGMSVVALGGGDLEKEFENSGASYYRIDRDGHPDLNAVLTLRKIVAAERVDIVHAYGPYAVVHIYLATLGMRGVRRVMTHHSVPGDTEVRPEPLGTRFTAKRMNAGIVPGRTLFPKLRKLGFDTSRNFFFLPYGTDRNRSRRGSHELKSELRLGESSFLIGMSADFDVDGAADHLTVCKALPAVFEKYPNARFIFSGSVRPGGEEDLEECVDFCNENGIGKRVLFSIERPDLSSLGGTVDIFVYSATGGAIPLELIDAMVAGVPVVVSDVEPLVELTGNGRCAEVFVRGDETELAQMLVNLMKNKRLRNKRAKDAKKYAEENHSIEVHLRMLKTLYSELSVRRGAQDDKKAETKDAAIRTDETESVLGLE